MVNGMEKPRRVKKGKNVDRKLFIAFGGLRRGKGKFSKEVVIYEDIQNEIFKWTFFNKISSFDL